MSRTAFAVGIVRAIAIAIAAGALAAVGFASCTPRDVVDAGPADHSGAVCDGGPCIACDDAHPCADSFVCEPDCLDGGVIAATCRPQGRVGDECGFSSCGGRSTDSCAAGLHCVSGVSDNPHPVFFCVEPGASPVGEPCADSADCIPGDFCTGHVCQGCDVVHPCPAGTACELRCGAIELGLARDCIPIATSAGDPCSGCGSLGFPIECALPLSCVLESCIAPGTVAQNEPCANDRDCASGFCFGAVCQSCDAACDVDAGVACAVFPSGEVCSPLGNAGEVCQRSGCSNPLGARPCDQQCAAGLICATPCNGDELCCG